MAAAGAVEAELKIGLPNLAQQIGPVGHGGVVEGKGNHLLQGWMELPEGGCCRGADHLHMGLELAGHRVDSGKGLQLLAAATGNQKQGPHCGGIGTVA